MTIFADSVCEGISSVASSGLGTITLSGSGAAVGDGTTGRTFSAAVGANADIKIRIVEGTAWEVCDSTYTHSGTTLSRGTLRASSTGSRVAFTSAAKVMLVADSEWLTRVQRLQQMAEPGGRLTLESGVPVSTSDQTAKTTIYYTPHLHNGIVLWDGVDWVPITFTETSLALGTLTSGLPYDVFGYISSGALALESLAWTNDSTRATAVTRQDGRLCKSGDKTRLLLGSFYTTATTTTEDSNQSRYLWNAYNRVSRRISIGDATSSWTYNSTTWRKSRNADTSFVQAIVGVAGEVFMLRASQRGSSSGSFEQMAIAISRNSTTDPTGSESVWNYGAYVGGAMGFFQACSRVEAPAAGRHIWRLMESAGGAYTVTFVGETTLMHGEIRC
jgi:hypothetical protein